MMVPYEPFAETDILEFSYGQDFVADMSISLLSALGELYENEVIEIEKTQKSKGRFVSSEK